MKRLQRKNFNKYSSFELIWELRKFLSGKRKKQLLISLISVIFAGISEIASLSIALPFITLLTDQKNFLEKDSISNFIKISGIYPDQLLSYVFYLLISIVFLAALMRLFNLWLIHRVVQAIGNDLSTEAFKRVLNQPYNFYLNNNTSKTISSLEKSIDGVIIAIESCILAFTGIFVILCIIATLLNIDLIVTISTFLTFLLSYYLISKFSKRILTKNSKYNVINQPNKLKIVQEGIGGIRDIILNNTQDYFVNLFSVIDKSIKRRIAENIFVASSPRYIIEALSVIIICSVAYFIFDKDYSNFNSIAILGTFALGAQKLLPNMQTSYRSWQSINNNRYQIIDLLNILNLEILTIKKLNKHLVFRSKISLKNIAFTYSNSHKDLFNNINIEIYKGEKLGIIGKTGSGKSTLVDLIMGLIPPTKGHLFIDGNDIYDKKNSFDLSSWRLKISHVPQNIFLSDRSFIENIAFGVPLKDIDINSVKESASKACIDKFISSSKKGYETVIGERGIRLSGGQRQRIGIARALYRKTNLLIFDEATSSLDNLTEDKVMQTIGNLSDELTIIIIAHRLRTVRNCDRILELKKGQPLRELKPKDILFD